MKLFPFAKKKRSKNEGNHQVKKRKIEHLIESEDDLVAYVKTNKKFAKVEQSAIEAIFPESLENSQTYKKEFINYYEKVHYRARGDFYKHLREEVIKFIKNRKDIRNEIDTNLLTDKKEIAEWIYCRFFNDSTSKERRMIEKKNFEELNSNSLFFKLGEISVPLDIMKIITSYMKKNMEFLNSFGLVNEKFYLLSLLSFNHITVNQKNITKIPAIVLENTKSINLTVYSKVTPKNLVYFFSNLSKIEEISKLEGNKAFEKLFKGLKSSNSQAEKTRENLARIKSLSFGTRLPVCVDRSTANWITYFPGLEKIRYLEDRLHYRGQVLELSPLQNKLKSVHFYLISNPIKLTRLNPKYLKKLELGYYPQREEMFSEIKKFVLLEELHFEVKLSEIQFFTNLDFPKLKKLGIKIRSHEESKKENFSREELLETSHLAFLEKLNQDCIVKIRFPNIFGINKTKGGKGGMLKNERKKENFENSLLLYFKSFSHKLRILLVDSGMYHSFDLHKRTKKFFIKHKIVHLPRYGSYPNEIGIFGRVL